MRDLVSKFCSFVCIASAVLALGIAAQAQTYELSVIYTFPQQFDASSDSPAGLVIDSSGNMYTSACCNDIPDFGSVIKITPQGVVSTLYTFTGGADGGRPGTLIRDSSGNLYGATSTGGSHSAGTIFKLSSTNVESTLYNFNNQHPLGPLSRDSAGNLYGYISVGNGSTQRMFKLTSAGLFSIVHTFCTKTSCTDGSNPVGSPIMDKSGNFYGMTETGGVFNVGTIFKLTPKFKYTVIYSFSGGSDGANPTGKLTQNKSGLMYGTATNGGLMSSDCTVVSSGCGTVFSVTAAGVFTVLYTFTDNGTDGLNPIGPVTLDSSGNLYGVTVDNFTGNDVFPTIFKISPQGVLTPLPSTSAEVPGLVIDSAGNVFGGTYNLFFDGNATIYELIKQ